jgi:hypothetical protein
MPVTVASRMAARAVIAAALAAGSLSLTVTAAGACTGSGACASGPAGHGPGLDAMLRQADSRR